MDMSTCMYSKVTFLYRKHVQWRRLKTANCQSLTVKMTNLHCFGKSFGIKWRLISGEHRKIDRDQ